MIHGVINLLALAHDLNQGKIHGGLFAVTKLKFLWCLECLMMMWSSAHGTQRSRTKETEPSTWKLQCK